MLPGFILDPFHGFMKWIRIWIWILPNEVDPGGSGSATLSLQCLFLKLTKCTSGRARSTWATTCWRTARSSTPTRRRRTRSTRTDTSSTRHRRYLRTRVLDPGIRTIPSKNCNMFKEKKKVYFKVLARISLLTRWVLNATKDTYVGFPFSSLTFLWICFYFLKDDLKICLTMFIYKYFVYAYIL